MKIDTPYCACSTPPGNSGVAVIRVGGEGASAVLDGIFTLFRSADDAKTVSEMRGYTAAFGRIFDPKTGAWIDDVICTCFRAPHSYTGEDIFEISCHGGHIVRQEILRILAECGARPAEPGEFTKRAFLAGKIDLSQAEAVMDVISAKSERALRAAGSQLAGGIRKELLRISEAVYGEFSALEMLVEFPEHEAESDPTPLIADGLARCRRDLEQLQATFFRGRILREGLTVVLAGIPNSGKSSLLNRVAGYERAIVTPGAGTTRDTLDVFVSLAGIPLHLIDTAGLRDSADEAEQIGVEKSREAMEESDLLLWLADQEGQDFLPDSAFFRMMQEQAKKREIGVVFSKSDILSETILGKRKDELFRYLEQNGWEADVFLLAPFSSVTGEGLDALTKAVVSIYEKKGQDSASEVILTHARHAFSVASAASFLAEAEAVLLSGQTADMACALLRSCLDSLGEITGETVSDELVKQIFSRFCVGK